MPDLFATKQAIRKLLGIANTQLNSIFKIETNATTVADATARGEIRIQNVDDTTNDEYLRIYANGNDAYYIESKNTGSGTARQIYFRAGTSLLGFHPNGFLAFTGNTAFNTNPTRFFNPATTFFYALQRSAITADRNITLPLLTADDEFVFKNHPQDLTDKNLLSATSKIVFPGNNTVDVQSIGADQFVMLRFLPTHASVGDGTNRAVFRLKNSTDQTNEEYLEFLSAGTNGYVIQVVKSGTGSYRNFAIKNANTTLVTYQADSGTVYTGGGHYFRNNQLTLVSPDVAAALIQNVANGGGSKTITWPALSANDVPVLEKHIQNLEGKTFKPSAADSGIIVPVKPSFTTIANNTARAELRLHNVDDATNDEYLRISALGTDGFKLEVLESGTGVYRQFRIYNGGVQCIVFDTNGQIHFTQIPIFDNNLWISDSDFSHSYQILRSNLTANRQITLPLLTADDQFTFDAHATTLSNKTLANPIASGYIEFNEIATPATPAANKKRLYMHSTDEKMKVVDSSGTVTDLEATGGGGTAREEMVAMWDTASTKTNIGSTYVDVYTTPANWASRKIFVDFTGKTQYRMMAYWTKVGTGTQQLKACDFTTATDVLHNFSNIATGESDSGLQTLPAWATGRKAIKLMALSSTAADDPVLEGAIIWLK